MDEVEDDVRCFLPRKATALLQDFPDIRRATAPVNLSTPWGQYKQHLGEHAMRSLENCALDLQEDADVTPDEVKQIEDAVDLLFDQVRNSTINKALKTWLLERLAAIRQMIDLYWIKGPKVVRQAFSAIAGEVAAYGKKFEEVKREDPTTFDRLIEMLNKLAGLAEKVEKLEPLLPYAVQAAELVGRLLLGPGGG